MIDSIFGKLVCFKVSIQIEYNLKFRTIQTKQMATTTTMYLYVPSNVNFWQFTNVQRGIVFMWMLHILLAFVVGTIKLIAGWMETEGEEYAEGENKESKEKNAAESSEAFDVAVVKSQQLKEQDTGSKKFMKKITEFETKHLPIMTIFSLCLTSGSSYAFSIVLYFLTLIPLILFNLLGFHKKLQHKVFKGFCENLWLFLAFFWFINIWTIGKFYEPYQIASHEA